MDLNIYTQTDATHAVERVKADAADPKDIADPGTNTSSGNTVTKDDVYTRVLKYVPAPLIGLYLMATNLVVSRADSGESPNQTLLWIIFGVFVAATIAFLVVRKVKRPLQIAMSVVAFAAVSTASPGPFQQIGGWDELWGTLALIGAGLLLIVFPLPALPDE